MYPVTMLCRVLRVSRRGFYAWQQHPISPRAEETRRLDVEIKELFEASKRRSGSPKITRALIDGGWQVGENRVARRMRVLGLRSIVRRRFTGSPRGAGRAAAGCSSTSSAEGPDSSTPIAAFNTPAPLSLTGSANTALCRA
jgi:hypothetical protein